MNDAAFSKELRNYEKKLSGKIQHERFSLKKLLHIYEYSCVVSTVSELYK